VDLMSQYSIKDIAKLANVSIATVSRVINSKGKYSEKTRRKVLKVIRETGYEIDSSAQSLRTNVTHTIGILVPDIKNSFFADLVQKIEEKLFEKEYSTIICNTDKNEQKEKAYLRMLENKKVDGIIVISGSYRHGFHFESSLKTIPYICIDREPADFEDTIFISSNHQLGAKEATKYLIDHGSKNPAIITSSSISTSIESRITGFREALSENNIPYNQQQNLLTYEDQTSLQAFLNTNKQIDSFFAVDDNIAIKTILDLKKLGYKVPDDYQVIGFDNIPSDQVLSPTLTTIAQNTSKIAETVVDSILKLLVSPKDKGSQIFIATRLIPRESTK
jgi:LacI family transcriptional regulator